MGDLRLQEAAVNRSIGRSSMASSPKNSIIKKKHKFNALGNLDGNSDVPEDELDALSDYIYKQIGDC